MNVKVGDWVNYYIAHTAFRIKVSDIDDYYIYCGAKRFDREHGHEVNAEMRYTNNKAYIRSENTIFR